MTKIAGDNLGISPGSKHSDQQICVALSATLCGEYGPGVRGQPPVILCQIIPGEEARNLSQPL